MRILMFLLALSSAFFVSFSHATFLDMEDLQPPDGEIKLCTYAATTTNYSSSPRGCGYTEYEARKQACILFAETYVYGNSPEYTWGPAVCDIDGSNFRLKIEGTRHYSNGQNLPTTTYKSLYMKNFSEEVAFECPPSTHPLHETPVPDSSHESGFMCAKEKDFCPEPTDNDPFVFGTGGQTEKCFKNPDGTQCKIQTDENGGYYMPVSYGSAEPVMCERAPDKEVDKTSEPEEKPAPEETDPQPEPDELSAINKINENLDAMNKNQIAASDSNDDRLDRVAEEIQISNELLGEIRYNTAMTDLNTDLANSLLQGILDKPVGGGGGGSGSGEGDGEEEQPFTIQAKRKNNNKGLNKLFTEQDLQTVTEEITQKRQELKDYIQQIKSESGSLFEVTPSFGGGYEERIVNIKGADVDMGLGRLASFFQMIAAAVLLISTLTALYILLGP